MADNRASKDIWVPQTTTNVTVADGHVQVWDQITMVARPIKPATGFGK